ncbi:MAG: hypothetical protein U0531_19505 [Dehalococcoidia bacterium]
MTVAGTIRPGARRAMPRLWRRWTLATAAGELLGFAIPTLAGIAAFARFGEPRTVVGFLGFLTLVVVAGAGEGATLGLCQWWALRRSLPTLSGRAWIGATAAAAAIAWLFGMSAAAAGELGDTPVAVRVAVWVIVAPPLLCTIGIGQWLVLRRTLPRSGDWIAANALAWLAGLPVTFIAPMLVPDGSLPVVWIAAVVGGGLLMGILVGAITGAALVRLVEVKAPGALPPTRATVGRTSGDGSRGA